MIQRITRFFSASIPLPQLQITKHSSFGTAGKGKKQTCLGLLDAFALEQEQGNHTPSPGASTARRTGSEVRFSGVVSANPLGEIGRKDRAVHDAGCVNRFEGFFDLKFQLFIFNEESNFK